MKPHNGSKTLFTGVTAGFKKKSVEIPGLLVIVLPWNGNTLRLNLGPCR